MDDELTWASPDGGPWWFEPAHFPYPVSRLFADVIDRICEGWFAGAQRYGASRARSRWAHVNGYLFYGERGETYAGDPARAERAVRERWWVREYERWFAEERPAVVARNEELQAVEVTTLDDAALRDHVRQLLAHVLDVAPLHFAHRGRELSREQLRAQAEAEGVSYERLSAAFAGASPATSRPAVLVARVAETLSAAGVDPRTVSSIDEVRAVPAAGAQLDEYLHEFGNRLLDSYDLACPTLAERPEIVLAAIRAATGSQRESGRPDLPPMSPALRQLFEETRTSQGTEDDDDGICILWPLGLLRRAMLELARRQPLANETAIFEMDVDELRAFLDGAGPALDDLERRLAARVAAAEVRPPAQLGGDAVTPDDLDAAATELRGTGVGTGAVRGRACVVRGLDSAGLAEIEPGDVLIAVTTTPGYNAVMPIVAAVATETHMGHTIICARELGIPAVVGVPGLVDAVPHGATVEVDAASGTVRVVAGS